MCRQPVRQSAGASKREFFNLFRPVAGSSVNGKQSLRHEGTQFGLNARLPQPRQKLFDPIARVRRLMWVRSEEQYTYHDSLNVTSTGRAWASSGQMCHV